METDEYQQAQAEGDAAEMGRLIMQAKVQGMNEYNASEGAQLALESELALAAAIRDDASSNQAYWDAGYRKSQEYSKGLAAGMASALVGTGSEIPPDCPWRSGGTATGGGAEESSPMILAKSCHDMDIIRWLMGVPCESVSSYGSLDWFRAETRRMAVQTAVFPAAPVRKDAPTTRKRSTFSMTKAASVRAMTSGPARCW